MSATTTICDLSTQITDLLNDLQAAYQAMHGDFCPRCHGKGYRVTWDTMDIMDGGCHDSAPCDNPNCNRSATKADPGKHDKYDKFHTVEWADIESVATPKQSAEIYRLRSEMTLFREFEVAQAEANQAAQELLTPRLGKRVRITRGGHEGVVGVIRWESRTGRFGVLADGQRTTAGYFFVNSPSLEVLTDE